MSKPTIQTYHYPCRTAAIWHEEDVRGRTMATIGTPNGLAYVIIGDGKTRVSLIQRGMITERLYPKEYKLRFCLVLAARLTAEITEIAQKEDA